MEVANALAYYDAATIQMAKRLAGIGENGVRVGKCRKAYNISCWLLICLLGSV
jgi:hypothetical protein